MNLKWFDTYGGPQPEGGNQAIATPKIFKNIVSSRYVWLLFLRFFCFVLYNSSFCLYLLNYLILLLKLGHHSSFFSNNKCVPITPIWRDDLRNKKKINDCISCYVVVSCAALPGLTVLQRCLTVLQRCLTVSQRYFRCCVVETRALNRETKMFSMCISDMYFEKWDVICFKMIIVCE